MSTAQPAPGERRRILIAFAPYLLLSAVHLVLLYTGPGWAVTFTKALLMPLLVLAVLGGARALRMTAPALLVVAIALSWAGDVILSFPGVVGFVVGLAFFLLAHLAYIALFLRMPQRMPPQTPGRIPRNRRPPAWTLVYVVWFAAFLTLLGPHLGALFAPVAVYGLVLGAMAAFAGGHGRLIAMGGALFVVSDSVLALGRFLPDYEFAAHDLVVMTTYLAAQGVIALGVVSVARGARAGVPSSPAPGPRASATAP